MQTKLSIRNLSLDTTAPQLAELFARYGEVISAELSPDKHTGEARGLAFVEMKTQVGAEAAIRFLHMRLLDGKQIGVSFSEIRERGPRKANRRGR